VQWISAHHFPCLAQESRFPPNTGPHNTPSCEFGTAFRETFDLAPRIAFSAFDYTLFTANPWENIWCVTLTANSLLIFDYWGFMAEFLYAVRSQTIDA
jgi:hypothetical protein